MISAEYPPAVAMPAHESNYRKAGRATYANVVIHCTDGHERAQPVAEMWQQANHGSSAHFVVGQSGGVIQAVSLADIAWHAHAANGASVGVEHCARTPGELGPTDTGLVPSQSLYEASAKLVAWLCRRMGLKPTFGPGGVIQGHAQIDPATTHTRCPDGCGFDWDAYEALVQQAWDDWDAVS